MKKRATARRPAKRKPVNGQIRVRMYNVGFGDCFLLRIPTKDGERRMLVDCGYHSQGQGEFDDKTLVNQIAEDLAGETLHVVVATHRHQDHISGFGEADLWTDIGVEEVWLPFTAHPDAAKEDPALRAWHGLMNSAAEFLTPKGKLTDAANAALGLRDEQERAAAEFMLWNARANAPGIQNLLTGMTRRDGGAAKRRFLPEDKRFPSEVVTSALPGVTTHVIGPPRDPALRKARKVPPSWGVAEGAGTPGADLASPFESEWRVPPDRLPGKRPFKDTTLETLRSFNDDLLRAAKAVDGFLNGESLVLVLDFGSARLLLPGDAEVGTWSAILANPDALALAAGATFLKVGHHGSHNATPLVFVREYIARRTLAAISTQQGKGKFRNGIPFAELLTTMDKRELRYVRSDNAVRNKGIFEPEKNDRWVDCVIPC